MTHEEEYYWVVMKPEAETFSLGKRVIMAKLIWEDGLAEWLLPGSLALWEPDKDFMILSKVSEAQGLALPDCCKDAEERSYHLGAALAEERLLQRNESWDALERLINDRERAAAIENESWQDLERAINHKPIE